MIENFRYFALQYLNIWCEYDSRFFSGLSSANARKTRLASLQAAASFYKVARTLPMRGDGTEARLDPALDALDAASDSMVKGIGLAVNSLAADLQTRYGDFAVSAASKFLWIQHRSPVIIYDSRAVACLKSRDRSSDPSDYDTYCREWRRQFAEHQEPIRIACSEIRKAKDFSLAYSMTDFAFTEIVSSLWFHERVFDQFLWRNARGYTSAPQQTP